MIPPKVSDFAQECAEKAAPLFVVRGRPIKADGLAQDIARRVDEIMKTTIEASESSGVLVMKNDVGIGVYVLVDVFFEDE